MEWAITAAQQQHAQAIADATAAAEHAQRTGEGPKPMMVPPYKHNWVISGQHPEHESSETERYEAVFLAQYVLVSDGLTLMVL